MKQRMKQRVCNLIEHIELFFRCMGQRTIFGGCDHSADHHFPPLHGHVHSPAFSTPRCARVEHIPTVRAHLGARADRTHPLPCWHQDGTFLLRNRRETPRKTKEERKAAHAAAQATKDLAWKVRTCAKKKEKERELRGRRKVVAASATWERGA